MVIQVLSVPFTKNNDMDMLNWVGKNLEEINSTVLYDYYFNKVPKKKGIDVYYLYNSQKGIDMILHEDNRIKAIHFYSGKQEGASKFAEELPFNLNFSFSRADVQRLLRVVNFSGGGNFSFLYGPAPIWDKYLFENLSLHLQYSPDEKNIELVTIDS
jgi:hypothetical protein